MADIYNNAGILCVAGTDPPQMLGYIMDFTEHGMYDASLGRIVATVDEVKRHNELLGDPENGIEAQAMKAGQPICLYLYCDPKHYERRPEWRKTRGTVSNFTGTLKFQCHTRTGRHNIAGARYDCWFKAFGREWHGVMYGDNTQLVRCRPLKQK